MYKEEIVLIGTFAAGEWTTGVASATIRSYDGSRQVKMTTDYGFTHYPPEGSQVVTLSAHGTAEGKVAARTFHRASRPKVLQQGEVALYTLLDDPDASPDAATHRITLTENQEVVICGNGNVRVRVGTTVFEVTDDEVFTNKNLRVGGSVTVGGSVAAEGEVRSGGVRLTTHTHPGDSGGTTGAPN